MPFAATWMDLEMSDWVKLGREGERLYDIPYIWDLKGNDTNELTKQKQTHRLSEGTYFCWGGGMDGGKG